MIDINNYEDVPEATKKSQIVMFRISPEHLEAIIRYMKKHVELLVANRRLRKKKHT